MSVFSYHKVFLPAGRMLMHSFLLWVAFLSMADMKIAHAQNVSKEDFFSTPIQDSFDLFASERKLSIIIYADFDSILADINADPSYHNATMIVNEEGFAMNAFNVRIKTRGNFRRLPQFCNFPPLLINFHRKEVEGTLFQGQDKLKLVTHCRTNDPMFQQYVVREYLVYKLYNIFNPCSYRVRLVHLEYIDTIGHTSAITSYGFFLEWEENMARRNNATVYNHQWVDRDSINQLEETKLALFQFMIRNNDWDIGYLKNITLVSVDSSGKLIPVPYDFDFSGIIDTPYREEMGVDDEDQENPLFPKRVYKGYCVTPEYLAAVIAIFNQKKRALYEVYLRSRDLDMNSMKSSIITLNSFYQIINSKAWVKKYISNDCE
jgi:hypothetical protein